jgi:uncharacterized membrane protein YbjE (DUF340 family)
LVHADKNWKLDQERQTSTGRVDLVLAVQLGHLFGKALLIFAVLATQVCDHWLQFLHLAAGLKLLDRQWQDHQAHKDREQDDRNTEAAGPYR